MACSGSQTHFIMSSYTFQTNFIQACGRRLLVGPSIDGVSTWSAWIGQTDAARFSHNNTGAWHVQVKEETGLDITELLVEDDRIERHIKQQRSKLFIITGVGRFFHLEAWSDQSWQ